MTGILKTIKISCTSSEAKVKALAVLQEVAEDVIVNNPGTVQYLVALPFEDVQKNEIYVIEEYNSLPRSINFTDHHRFETRAAFESCQGMQPVKALEALVSDTGIRSKPLEVHVGSVAIRATSGRPLTLSLNPAILLVSMEYKPGTLVNAVTGWKDMAKGAVRSVPGVNVFTVMEDTEMSSIRTIEVLDSWESLSALVKSDVAKQNIEHNGKDRTCFKSAIKLHAVAGFVGRS